MNIENSQEPAGSITDDFEIVLDEEEILEKAANHRGKREIVILIPDGLNCSFERDSYAGGLCLRIAVEDLG